ncbi:HNH endonuclease [Mycobacterium sp. Y57]|uniref:HNH endonuclease signature motif containing protein n=1 Tax=Mycolicibacterium xanthum TaxID=2796469 RepID=UPI001C84D83A|nr:HNH endonuclease signature motif containing protein [Mycolicibacterium xanthum]MBX7434999.1 HNH endonuclease [Mycolicibacterium xanthum]
MPPALLADLIAAGATIRPITTGADLPPCTSYRPSAALDRFIRTRDLTCRAPGCDRPAITADIDHTDPWPTGATHPANNKCYCRLHHLIKTFHPGFTDTQHPDGTLTVTTPTGHTYTTKPFTALLFPHWNTTTEPPPRKPTPPSPPAPGRTLMMPTRRQTRAQAKAAHITRERRLNALQRELERSQAQPRPPMCKEAQREARQQAADNVTQSLSRPPGYQPDYGDDPPPF